MTSHLVGAQCTFPRSLLGCAPETIQLAMVSRSDRQQWTLHSASARQPSEIQFCSRLVLESTTSPPGCVRCRRVFTGRVAHHQKKILSCVAMKHPQCAPISPLQRISNLVTSEKKTWSQADEHSTLKAVVPSILLPAPLGFA